MDSKELKKLYIDFFIGKGHSVIPNAPLIPENDPTVLFTTAGMHPIVPFLLGQPHPQGKRLVNFQKCIRTVDIESVGDNCHHTFFEMLGNWSLGDYFKKEAISMTFEFLTKVLKLPLERLAFSCFEGDENAPKDEESYKILKSLGVSDEKIAFLGKDENWWGPAGETGPCGPDSEVFYWSPNNVPVPEKFDVDDKRWVEIGNNVFMQYDKQKDGSLKQMQQKNVDFGGGVERQTAVLSGLDDNYLTNDFLPLIQKIENISGKKYADNKRSMRIIADHVRAATFILAEKVVPKNVEHGYVLRRLLRRSIRHGKLLGIEDDFLRGIVETVIENYKETYPHLEENRNFITSELEKEEKKFKNTLNKGLRKFQRIAEEKGKIDGKDAFLLFQSFGFPIEMTKELGEESNIEVDEKGFNEEEAKHQQVSKIGSEKKFGSGLADSSEQTIRLHTATHLLNEALRRVLKKDDIYQRGSNITPERLRFDFNFDRKLADEELKQVEDLVNQKINEAINVKKIETTVEEAKKMGAQGVFDEKYGDKVFVYSIGDFSCEICSGPHVENTNELGHFKIVKEKGVAAGVRRIRAVLEK